ncbi:hypothetical protein EV368DRAFT_69047 [Lentinula lateritia]|nr:hypothetical protein EV368DRAFT_69047 [Lentinula lateritia]
MAPPKFAPDLNLPPRLQRRLDNWRKDVPKWQHQMYGPLNSYLTIRFPPDKFIVKPQCLLREEIATVEEDWEEGVSMDSIDSHGDTRLYPDFCIDQYWGADNDRNPRADVIRVIIEVGSKETGSIRKKTSKNAIISQLRSYMQLAGPQRWQGRLLGVAMLGAEVFLLEMRDSFPVKAAFGIDIDPLLMDISVIASSYERSRIRLKGILDLPRIRAYPKFLRRGTNIPGIFGHERAFEERWKTQSNLLLLETNDTWRVHTLKELALVDVGWKAVFQASTLPIGGTGTTGTASFSTGGIESAGDS